MPVSSRRGCFHLGVQQPPCSSHQIIPQLAASILASGSTITHSLVCWPLPGWYTIAEPDIGDQRPYIPRTRIPQTQLQSKFKTHQTLACYNTVTPRAPWGTVSITCASRGGEEYLQKEVLYHSRIGLRGQRKHSIHGKLNLHMPAIGTSAAGKLQDAVFYSPGTISQAELKPHRTLCFKKNYTRSWSRLFQNAPPDLRLLQSLYILQLFLRTPNGTEGLTESVTAI